MTNNIHIIEQILTLAKQLTDEEMRSVGTVIKDTVLRREIARDKQYQNILNK